MDEHTEKSLSKIEVHILCLQDENDRLAKQIAEARAALLAILEAVPGTDDAADRVQRIVSEALAGRSE